MHPDYTPEFAAYFWQRVNASGGPDACWPWLAARTSREYGYIRRNGKRWAAHRVAYEIAVGPIPDGMVMRHQCDNPPCCNPRHLLPGTQKQNMEDRIRHGRGYHRGDAHWTHLYPDGVARGERNGSHTKPERRVYGARNGSVLHPDRVPRGDRHYRRTQPHRVPRGEATPQHKVTENDVREIRRAYAAGEASYPELARRYDINLKTVWCIVRRLSWKHVT